MYSDSGQVLRVPETINFPEEEEKIINYWKKIDAFQTSLKQSKGKPRYSFYDGPPFATGLPHYGHILAGTIKDIVTRYAHQQGYYVERRFGWDCHGLPVEFEIDKKLGIKGPEDVLKMGIDKYNLECRQIVARYSKEWEVVMGRIGRWIDFKNDYKTLYPWFMESVWWVFKQLYLKGLVYQGNKVMPYSTACNTPLSNFESGQNYKDVVDPAVTVSLPLLNDKDGAALLIWTTTPWTLPSNLAACVHPELIYARFEQTSTKKTYIMMESRIETIFAAGDYTILKRFPGKELRGLRYEPIFDYFQHLKDKAFVVLTDGYVTEESGTGVVHQAPYFGEDDNRVCLAAGVITKDQDPVCPVDPSGYFLPSVRDFQGQYVKDADKNIINNLKTRGRLVHQSQVKHSYPFCWRSDTPLIYRAVPSWFIRVEHMQEELLNSSKETYWVPDFIKEKRFGNWLRDARDWAVSRNRYWGTPIPIWVSPKGDEIRCIGSIAELEELTGQKVTDLHRESIDHLEIPSQVPGNPPLRRIPEVFDCWFESGTMPYAQNHYPFENPKEFEERFPADFIAEGIDQTRGWFYTLIVVSTALFGKAPFKNLIANGLVLASDGQKMSKRKSNYPDPLELVNKYGADALRLYLINSPVVRAENLRFKEEGVRDIVKDVLLPWFNAFRFLMQNVEIYVQENNKSFVYDEKNVVSSNIMDRWILSFTQSLLAYVRKEMGLYHLYNVVPRLTKYIDYLTNWYVRMNRKRLKGEGGTEDCSAALSTLFNVLLNIVKMMAPFAPFLSESMFQHLKLLSQDSADSVHFTMLPEPDQKLIDTNIERAVARMQSVIELGRVIRDRKTIPIKYPLPEVIVVHHDPQYIEDILSLQGYILSELNVRRVSTTTDKSKFGITLRAEPDHRLLGARLKQDFKAVTQGLKSLTDSEINKIVNAGFATIAGHRVELEEIRLILKCENLNSNQYEVHSDNEVVILLDVTPDSSMQDEGMAREIINRIQKLRKKAHLVPTDEVSVFYRCNGDLERIAKEYTDFIETAIKASFKGANGRTANDQLIIEETQKLKDTDIYVALTKNSDVQLPVVKWTNLALVGVKSKYCNGASRGVVLLEVVGRKIGLDSLKKAVSQLFGVEDFELWSRKYGEVSNDRQVDKLNGDTVFVTPVGKKLEFPDENGVPFCKTVNFTENGVSGTVILENPQGNCLRFDVGEVIKRWVKSNQG
ncbi:isoleucine--tRNA ligase, cytoplasmic [Anoplophora glabripennis]|nr:isoleucine--tRNA ligase, cytoplasmic [Anoplophora glabripennis]